MRLRRETLMVALDALRANKLRAFLTGLGVVIGSACIVLVVTVALTGRKFVLAQIEGVGSNLVWAQYVEMPQQARALSYELTPADLDAIEKSVPQVAEVAGTRDTPTSIVEGGVERGVTLIGVTEGFQAIRHLVILRGRYFDPQDMEARGKVCLITKDLADRIYRYESPVGKSIRVGEFTFTIIGVFRERVATFGLSEIQRESVIIPYTLMRDYTGQDYFRTIYAQAKTPDDVPGVTRQVDWILKSRHPATAVYQVQNLTGILDAAQKISLALSVVLVIIAFIALLISGIGIMNIMLVTVTERTREIGIRKAIGAARQEILYQFLIEALLISGVGAIIGIVIGVGIPVAVQPLLPGNLRVPVSGLSVVVAFLVSCGSGVFFGYLPANEASKLQPVDSLRYE
ncbi:MAG TPA: ABC transporter permease [Candidatus Acidoferrales bacterium]|nr:ABC transporter permease [Candidatus Acidoferrales bacterium]